MASRRPARRIVGVDGRDPRPRSPRARPGARQPRPPLRREVLHRGDLDRHLLPAGVPRAEPEARERPLLRDRRLPPPRPASGPCLRCRPGGGAGHAGLARHVGCRPPGAAAHPGRRAGRLVRGRARRRASGSARATSIACSCSTWARRRSRSRRPAGCTSRSACSTRRPADHRDRAGGRLRQPAALQRRVPDDLPARAARARAGVGGAGAAEAGTRSCSGSRSGRPTTGRRCATSSPRARCRASSAWTRAAMRGRSRRTAATRWSACGRSRASTRSSSACAARRRRRCSSSPPPRAATFDLAADPARIALAFEADPLLAPLVERRPGLRIPGAWDPFECAVRAVLGQQVSVAGGAHAGGAPRGPRRPRDRGGHGRPHASVPVADGACGRRPQRAGPHHGARVARRSRRSRAPSPRRHARPRRAGGRRHGGAGGASRASGPGPRSTSRSARSGSPTRSRPRTSCCAAWPAAGGASLTARALEARAEPWRPWRGYAVLHLWRGGRRRRAPGSGRPRGIRTGSDPSG